MKKGFIYFLASILVFFILTYFLGVDFFVYGSILYGIVLFIIFQRKNSQKQEKQPVRAENSILSITRWKVGAFLFFFVPYALLYSIQGFMSYVPQFWPLFVVLFLTACVYFINKWKWLFFMILSWFSITMDAFPIHAASGSNSASTYVFSPIILVFWGIYLIRQFLRKKP